MKLRLLILLSVIFVIGCSSNNGLSSEEKNQAFQNYIVTNKVGNVDKVTTFKFRGWNSLTNEYLIISSSRHRQYLLELSGFCSDITWANTLIINRSTNSSLHARFDSLSTLETPQLKCMIKNIYPITEQQEDDIKKLTESEEKSSQTISEPEKISLN